MIRISQIQTIFSRRKLATIVACATIAGGAISVNATAEGLTASQKGPLRLAVSPSSSSASSAEQNSDFSPETLALLRRAEHAANQMRELLGEPAEAAPQKANLPTQPAKLVKASLAQRSAVKTKPKSTAAKLTWKDYQVRKGDTLSQVFENNGLGFADWNKMLKLGSSAKRLKKLRPGDNLRFAFDRDNQFAAMELTIDEVRTLRIDRIFNKFHAKVVSEPHDTKIVKAEATIKGSLYGAAKKAGLSDKLTMTLTEIFAWDIDFALDIRAGDKFAVVYEKYYKNGKFIRNGAILAAEFVNRGRTVRAMRYVNPQGVARYYSPEGRSLRKAFLRTPGDFTRVSSRFTKRRKHPILKVWRAHRGVDYAAPRGTKIIASGSGKVKFVGVKRGYGKVVILDHGRGYETLYAHMSKFKRALKNNQRVKQGEVIGYVGSSGAATGPHLHYEFRMNGEHKDPLKVALPMAAPIPKRHMAEFRRQASPMVALLEGQSGDTQVASLKVDL